MKILILIGIIIVTYYLKCVLKLSFDLKSFIRKGFKKKDNQFGLFCYTGKQGHGKTYSAINFCISRKLATNCIIITNVKSFNIFSDTVFIEDIQELIKFVIDYCNKLPHDSQPNILIFFDEIFTILEKHTRINKEILSFISQLRKRKICFITTAQEWLEINITFRRYVRFQIDCNMISLPILKNAVLINKINDGESIHWSNDENEYVSERISTKIMKGNLAIIESYDTFETVQTSNKSLNRQAKRRLSVLQSPAYYADKPCKGLNRGEV